MFCLRFALSLASPKVLSLGKEQINLSFHSLIRTFVTMIEIETIVSIVFKGMMIGIIASAPMGPVGVLCLQRTLNKGRWYGFVTGCGAALSDLFYALITGYGMSFVFDYVSNNIFYLQLFGSILLLFFGKSYDYIPDFFLYSFHI